MPRPQFQPVTTDRNQPIWSTSSLAIASLIVAACAIIVGLSPLLLPALLPIALLGLLLATLSLFSYRDHSSLQVGSLAINGCIMLLAMLRGPMAIPQSANAAALADWDPISWIQNPDQTLHGRLLQRAFGVEEDLNFLDLVIQWDVSEIHGCWNWFEGMLILRNSTGEFEQEFAWHISGPIHSSAVVMNGHRIELDSEHPAYGWLYQARYEDVEITFRPVRWEHAALGRSNGILVPMPEEAHSRKVEVRGAR